MTQPLLGDGPLIPLDSVGEGNNTPTSKSAVIRLVPTSA